MIRVMTIEDYDEVYKLWKKIRGFGIRSIDDSKEGVERFLRRNPTTSFVAVKEGKIVESITDAHGYDDFNHPYSRELIESLPPKTPYNR